MRIHRLEVSAFGPFAGTEVVDFDALSDAGLFLLTGQTGAGKTSILDAVCFALFGQVPGARNNAKSFKSHHADSSAVPRVDLEVTMRGRRFRLVRQPGWHRPSSRARSGYVEEKAKASAEELVAGEWHPLTTRVDEVGHLVSRVLGMNREQFCQVVMLPQGQFQTFLRAGAKERHDVLEALFETRRFQEIERWLVEHRRRQDALCREHEETIETIWARVLEVSWSSADDADALLSSQDGEAAVDRDEQERQATQSLTLTAERLDAARLHLASCAAAAKKAEHAYDEARSLADRQSRHREAAGHLQTLRSTRDVVANREAAIERARAASVLAPLVEMLDQATAAASTGLEATRQAMTQTVAFAASSRLPTVSAIEQEVGQVRRVIAGLGPLRATQAEIDELRPGLDTATAELEALGPALAEMAEALRVRPAEIAAAELKQQQTRDAAAGAEALAEQVTRAEDMLAAAEDAVRLREANRQAEQQRLVAREAQTEARSSWLDIRQRYLDGIAVELARGLTDGCACPVCGSPTHPSPARPTARHASTDDETRALEFLQAAEEDLATHDRLLAEITSSLSRAEALSDGRDVRGARAEVEAATSALAAARSSANEHTRLTEELAALRASTDNDRRLLSDAESQQRLLVARVADLQTRVDKGQSRLREELGVGTRVDDREADQQEQLSGLLELVAERRRLDDAERHAHELSERLARQLADSMFSSAAEVIDATMPAVDIAAADALNRSYAADLESTTRLVEDPTLAAAAHEPRPDLPELAELAAAARERHSGASADAANLERRQVRLEALLSDFSAAVAGLRPLQAARDLAADVSAMCAGTAADNMTKTRLSHYVLAARLEQVVAAGNVRLAAICSGRYQLEHSMERGVGDTKGGLSLRVIDTYTGQRRDPATLSGGETFYVSLALALGLADLVTNEVGGAELATLFVDEGFGSLDSETLDEVMDELDALRSGGRCVGLVSHLSELRMRIPMQLRVLRSRRGSHVAT